MAFISYMDEKLKSETKLLIQSGKIKLTSHGIPPFSKKDAKKRYIKKDRDREYMKIPLDLDQPSCEALRKFIEQADEWAGSEEMRKKLFGTAIVDKKKQKREMDEICLFIIY